MNGTKKGTSIISLTLCAVALALVTSALVIANNNSAMYKLNEIAKDEIKPVETTAYVKIYSVDEVETVARQAFVDNYLSYWDEEVDLEGFTALVIGDVMRKIPLNQLDDFNIVVTEDGVKVNYID